MEGGRSDGRQGEGGWTGQAEVTVGPGLHQVRVARWFVVERCGAAGVDPDTTDTAVLLASELVTNALVHGSGGARVGVEVGPATVLLAVADDDPRSPHLHGEDPDAVSGRGLQLVEVLADRWGVRSEAFGKTVWCAVQRPDARHLPQPGPP